MKTFIKIKADTNDADYIQSFKEITEEELKLIRPIIDAIKNFTYTNGKMIHRHNFSTMDRDDEPSPRELYVETGQCTEDALEVFFDFVPYIEGGIHTIESIKIYKVQDMEKLL